MDVIDSTVSDPPSVPAPASMRGVHPPSRVRKRRRALLRGVRQGLLALVIAGATAGTVLALRPRPIPVDVAHASRGPLSVVVQESGVTRVKDRYLVSAPVTGNLARVSLEAGDPVQEGDALAEIAPALSALLDERTRAQAQARLAAARSALGQVRAQEARALAAKQLSAEELARVTRLWRERSTSEQSRQQAELFDRMRAGELSSALFASKVAAEEVRIARVTLEGAGQHAERGGHVGVTAPVSGNVLRVHQKSAGLVQAGVPLLELGDPAALEVVVDLLTTDAVNVQPGTPVEIEGWGRERALAGCVRRVEPSAFTRLSALGVDEQRVNVVIALTSPRDEWTSLGDGYQVEVRIVLWQHDDVLKIPHGALFRHGGSWAVFRISDGVARRVVVAAGQRGEAEVEIRAGLSPGDELVVHPGDRVKDGVRVDVR